VTGEDWSAGMNKLSVELVVVVVVVVVVVLAKFDTVA